MPAQQFAEEGVVAPAVSSLGQRPDLVHGDILSDEAQGDHITDA